MFSQYNEQIQLLNIEMNVNNAFLYFFQKKYTWLQYLLFDS